MKRSIAAFLVLLALSCAAHAFGLGLGNRFGKLGSFGKSGAITPPAGIGSALLIDNVNPALLIDNVNPACLAGGC